MACGTTRTTSTYDALKLADGRVFPIRAQTIAGLIPVFAVAISDRSGLLRYKDFDETLPLVLQISSGPAAWARRPWRTSGSRIASGSRSSIRTSCERILTRVLDPEGMLSPYGVRVGIEAACRASVHH
jgi:hypothetical protein